MQSYISSVRRVWHYLANLEWTEKKQPICLFCTRDKIEKVAYEDDDIIVFEDIKKAGLDHWLIVPITHVRDIESLTKENIPLLEKMEAAKRKIQANYPPKTRFHCGYHRGRRRLAGDIFWPDIISIHHLHLHVIVEPRFLLKMFKYPPWLPLMWKTDHKVMKETRLKGSEIDGYALSYKFYSLSILAIVLLTAMASQITLVTSVGRQAH